MPAGSATDDERHETEAQPIDRNLTELLQELRIAGLGVQVLSGFLLSLPFTNKFVLWFVVPWIGNRRETS